MDAADLERRVAEVALAELREDKTTREAALREMRTWIQQNPSIVHCRTDDNFLLRFLRVKKYDVSKAQQMLFNFLNLKEVLPPAFLNNHDVTSPSVSEFMVDGFYFASPHRDALGRRVFMMVVERIDLSKKYTFANPARTILLSSMTAIEDEVSQVLGYVFVFDAAKVSFRHLSMWPSPIELFHFLRSGESAMPMRIKGVHLLNVPAPLAWCVNLLKSAVSKKIKNRLVVHTSLKTLHEKIDPKVLPKEYGGVTAMDEMIESWKEELVRRNETIKEFDKIKLKKVDKRRKSGLSFRNLELD